MKKLNQIAVLPGDGIGPEVVRQAVKVIDSINRKFDHQTKLIYGDIGACAIDKYNDPLPSSTLDACLQSDAILLGAIGDPKYDNNPAAKIRPEQGLLALRKQLKLYANIRPLKCYDQLLPFSPLKPEVMKDVDFVIYRELTSGIYFGKSGYDKATDTAFDECAYSRPEIERIAKKAFEAALQRSNKLTLIDKANVLETSRLWRKVVMDMQSTYPNVEVNFLFVDNAAMQMILRPSQFDVILCSNMFGDIISDEASVLAGSIGVLASASVGEASALFEPIHGSYPQAAGKNIANPIGTILSVAMMYRYFGYIEEANTIESTIEYCMENNYLTVDLNQQTPCGCEEFGNKIAEMITRLEIVST